MENVDVNKHLDFNWMSTLIVIGVMTIFTIVYLDHRVSDIEKKLEKKEQPGTIVKTVDASPVRYDYEIDLKPNFIIVYSRGGNVDTIPYSMENTCSPLEAFFERDNM